MIKKYLTTPEEILALRNTDTKLYREKYCGYFKFVDGVPCFFSDASDIFFNTEIDFNPNESKLYILVKENLSNATEKDIGKLCWFWDDEEDEDVGNYGVLKYIRDGKFYINDLLYYDKCRRLTFEEVVELTGYMENK